MNIDPNGLPEPFKSRILTYRDTLNLCKGIKAESINTYKYIYKELWKPIKRYDDETIIQVLPIDTFVSVKEEIEKERNKFKIACLNLADDSFPTGCANTGSGAQEESLCYRSTLSSHLDIKYYPLKNNELLYSSNIIVFKDTEEKHFQMIKYFITNVISMPGIRHPILDENNNMKESDLESLKIKIETILQVAYNENIDILVLGALGCGAWKNNPTDVANTFKIVLDSFPYIFKKVIFAIKGPKDDMYFTKIKTDNNYETFLKILN